MKNLKEILGNDTVSEMDAMSKEDLKNKIVQAEKSMEEAKRQLEDNPKYQELKESINSLRQSLKDVNKRQRSIIKYALTLLD